ncbi:MAG: DUF1460 domain-containing protein [Candidatus Marinimicrobia bacterium]|nr:DUF1460 domain-containing protein [Candidatus Neomarinimicrobiota bacterium]
MKKFLHSFCLLGLLALMACGSRIDEQAWLASLPKPWQMSRSEVSAIMPRFHQRYPLFEDRLRALALWRVGTPYAIYQLGEEVEPDLDPIFRLDLSDCTAHVLTSLSLAQSHTWDEARTNMISLHYKPDANGQQRATYKSRWHYTADRLLSNPSTADISGELVAAENLASVDITLNRGADGKEFLDLAWSRTLTARYIPNDQITLELLSKLPRIVGVAFVKPSYFKIGLLIGHEGMIIDGSDLIHAGQEAGETVRQDFMGYYFREDGPLFGGIMIYAFRPLGAAGPA